MAFWIYTSTFNTDGSNMTNNPINAETGLQDMIAGTHLIRLGAGDVVYVAAFINGAGVGVGNDAINSASGGHDLVLDGALGSLNDNVIELTGTQNENTITVGEFGGLRANGNGDAIRLTGSTVADTFNDIDNRGSIFSRGGNGIFTTVDDLSVINSGRITGGLNGIAFAAGAFGSVFNETGAFITGGNGIGVAFGTGAGEISQLYNYGTIGGGVTGGVGDEFIVNAGRIIGDVSLGDGADTYDGSDGGSIVGSVDFGAGNDVAFGGAGRDVFIGGSGNDEIEGGGGDDSFRAGQNNLSDGNDTFDGGSGFDTYNANLSNQGVTIDLAQGFASGARIGSDTLISIERAIGTNSADTIIGDDGDNVLSGLNGVDTISGGGGFDRIDGGTGNDIITGGLGRDVLTGGTNNDVFVYLTEADSGITAATRDRIVDMTVGQDDIDISALAGTFTFIAGAAFSGANQVRFQASGLNTLVEISTDADTDAEMAILLNGTIALTANEFVL